MLRYVAVAIVMLREPLSDDPPTVVQYSITEDVMRPNSQQQNPRSFLLLI